MRACITLKTKNEANTKKTRERSERYKGHSSCKSDIKQKEDSSSSEFGAFPKPRYFYVTKKTLP